MDARAKDGPIRNQLGLSVMQPAVPAVCGTLSDGAHMGGVLTDRTPIQAGSSLPSVSMCLNAGAMGRIDAESETLIPATGGGFDVAHALRGEGHDASEDGTSNAILTPNGGRGGIGVGAVAFPIDTQNMTEGHASGGLGFGNDGDPSFTLTKGHSHAVAIIAIQGAATRDNPSSGPDGIGVRQDVAAYTLEARSEVQAVAFDLRGREGGSQFEGPHDTANIRAASGGSSKSYIAQTYAVRRLTPEECEKLQGFPPGYTAIDHTGKPIAGGPRYKMLGNSMACNVMRHIGERIAEVEAITAVHRRTE